MQETQAAVRSIKDQITTTREVIKSLGCQNFILRPCGNQQYVFLSFTPQKMSITGDIAEIPSLIKTRLIAAGLL